MFFFPYQFWNENCEVPEDTGLYGTSSVAVNRIRNFFLEVKERLEQRFKGYKLHYVIPPENAAIDRDKAKTTEILIEHEIPTSEQIEYTCLQDILDNVTQRGVFIKCRYGSEGKGITFLGYNSWKTNYRVEEQGLGNYGINDPWPFTDITGRTDLLEQLLQHEIVVEREILCPDLFDGKKFDVRAYVVAGKTPHFLVRVDEPHKIITNFSQGAKALHHPKTGLTQDYIALIKENAIKAAQAIGSQFLGVDIMFDGNAENGKIVEVQTFTDFPDIDNFNLGKYMVKDESGLFL